jgi:hypothetical protein
MNPATEIEFVVDEKYENEKGIFTVLSIQRDAMVIRWESGEEIRTDIELQRNIQSRRQWEQLQKENVAKAGKAGAGKDGSAKGPSAFNGLQVSDFKNSASGTRWRGRNQLGGAVTSRLPESRFNFNSWAFGNKPELHWLDTQHQKNQNVENGAKFFLRVDNEAMVFGFSIGRPDSGGGTAKCWEAFLDWLAQEENNRQLLALAEEYNLTIYSSDNEQPAVLLSKNGAWCYADGSTKKSIDNISAFIGSISTATGIVNIEIAKKTDKKEALAAGKNIVDDVAKVFTRLAPLYHAAWPVLV